MKAKTFMLGLLAQLVLVSPSAEAFFLNININSFRGFGGGGFGGCGSHGCASPSFGRGFGFGFQSFRGGFFSRCGRRRCAHRACGFNSRRFAMGGFFGSRPFPRGMVRVRVASGPFGNRVNVRVRNFF